MRVWFFLFLSLSSVFSFDRKPLYSHIKIVFLGYNMDDFPFIDKGKLDGIKQVVLGNLLNSFPQFKDMSSRDQAEFVGKFQYAVISSDGKEFSELSTKIEMKDFLEVIQGVKVKKVSKYGNELSRLKPCLLFKGVNFGLRDIDYHYYISGMPDDLKAIQSYKDASIESYRYKDFDRESALRKQDSVTHFLKELTDLDRFRLSKIILSVLESSVVLRASKGIQNLNLDKHFVSLIGLETSKYLFEGEIIKSVKLGDDEKFLSLVKEKYEEILGSKREVYRKLKNEKEITDQMLTDLEKKTEEELDKLKKLEERHKGFFEKIKKAQKLVGDVDLFLESLLSFRKKSEQLVSTVDVIVDSELKISEEEYLRKYKAFHGTNINLLITLLSSYLEASSKYLADDLIRTGTVLPGKELKIKMTPKSIGHTQALFPRLRSELGKIFYYTVHVTYKVTSGSFSFSGSYQGRVPYAAGDFILNYFEESFEESLLRDLKLKKDLYQASPIILEDFFKKNEKFLEIYNLLGGQEVLDLQNKGSSLLEAFKDLDLLCLISLKE